MSDERRRRGRGAMERGWLMRYRSARGVYTWRQRVHLRGARLTSVRWQSYLPAIDARQRLVDRRPIGTPMQDAQGNRVLKLEGLAPGEPLDLMEQVEVSSERAPIRDVPFPLRAPIAAPAEFLGDGALVHPGAPRVQALAAALSAEALSGLGAVVAFARYCNERVRYDDVQMAGVCSDLEALQAGAGACDEKSHLLAALCRAVGLPAALVCGRTTSEGHAWVEVTLDGALWFPVEATYSPMQIGWLDPDHVKEARAPDCAIQAARLEARVAPGGAPPSFSVDHDLLEVRCEGERASPFEARLHRTRDLSTRLGVTFGVRCGLAHAAAARVLIVSTHKVEVRIEGQPRQEVWMVFNRPGEEYVRALLIFAPAAPGMLETHPVEVHVDEFVRLRFEVEVTPTGIASVREQG